MDKREFVVFNFNCLEVVVFLMYQYYNSVFYPMFVKA